MIYNPRPDFGHEAAAMKHEPTSSEPLHKKADMGERANECLGVTVFLVTTLVLCFEIAADVWLIVIFGLEGQMELLGIGVLLLAITSIFTAFYYSLQMKREGVKESFSMACCLLINFPAQLGIIGERLMHLNAKADACCSSKDFDRLKKDWVFAKLKLGQSVFQSLPFIMMNIYSSLAFEHHHVAQYVSVSLSSLSLVLAAAAHEVIRKERLRKMTIGAMQAMFVFHYKAWIIMSRTLALGLFTYYYHQWVVAVILPHIALVFSYLFGVYREVWKVDVWKVIMHSFYSLIAYFPVHNEYRPMGEIMGFYILFMAENILMISLPTGVPFYTSVHRHHYPGTIFYNVLAVSVLVGSALGLIFMCVFYFACHRSSDEIHRSHFKCLPAHCPLCREEEDVEEEVHHLPPEGRRIYYNQNEANALIASAPPRPSYPSNLLDETGPPSYRSRPQSYADGLSDYKDTRSSGDGDSETKEPLADDFKPVFDDEDEVDIGEGNAYRPPQRRYKKHKLNKY